MAHHLQPDAHTNGRKNSVTMFAWNVVEHQATNSHFWNFLAKETPTWGLEATLGSGFQKNNFHSL